MLDEYTLALDTSGNYCSVIYCHNSEVIYDKTIATIDHSKGLGLMLSDALVGTPKVSKILVTTGPGSFTGLRCGISWALGLSHGFSCKVHGISCFRGFINSHRYRQEKVIVLLDAKRDDFVYCQIFSQKEKEMGPPYVVRLSSIVETLEPNMEVLCNEDYIYNYIKDCKYKYLIKHVKMSELVQINSIFYSEIFPNYVQQAYVN